MFMSHLLHIFRSFCLFLALANTNTFCQLYDDEDHCDDVKTAKNNICHQSTRKKSSKNVLEPCILYIYYGWRLFFTLNMLNTFNALGCIHTYYTQCLHIFFILVGKCCNAWITVDRIKKNHIKNHFIYMFSFEIWHSHAEKWKKTTSTFCLSNTYIRLAMLWLFT